MWCASAATCAPSRSLRTASSAVAASRPAPATTKRSCSDASERLGVELPGDVGGETAHVLTLERASGGHRARVARRVAVTVLDRRRRDDDVIDLARDRALRRAGDEPCLAHEPAHRFQRQRRLPLVRDGDEHVGLGRMSENELERLRRATARERRVVRGPAPGEEHARALRQPTRADPIGHLLQPLGLVSDGRSGQLSGHESCLYHRTPWRSSRRRHFGNGIRVVTAPFPQVGFRLVLRHARGRLAVRDRGLEGHRPLRRAHVLQGDGAAADRAHDLDRDRRDRG